METTTRPIGDALIYLATEVEREIEADFNRWAEGHLRDNLRLAGFLAARRLRLRREVSADSTSPTYLTLYDLVDSGAIEELDNPGRDSGMPKAFPGRFQFSRALFRALGTAVAGAQPRGPAVLHTRVDVEPAYNDAFLEWYAGEHVPAVLAAPGMLSVRRFENLRVDGEGRCPEDEFRYLTLYEMEDAGVIDRPETIEASKSTLCPAGLEPHRRSLHAVYEEFVTMEA